MGEIAQILLQKKQILVQKKIRKKGIAGLSQTVADADRRSQDFVTVSSQHMGQLRGAVDGMSDRIATETAEARNFMSGKEKV